MKIDKIEQTVEVQEVNFNYQIRDVDYTITPIGEGKATLKTNPGKTLNEFGINLGAEPGEAKEINQQIIDGLGVKLLSNNNIEYFVDVYTDFKLINNKHILKTFLKALEIHKYKSAKIDFKIEKDKWIDKAELKGLKGYKKSRALKIYSKYEEQNLGQLEGDLIRLELVLGTRALEQNKIENISDVEKAKQEIREFLATMRGQIIKVNRYSKITVELIEKMIKEI
ncbi:MAG: hypothetical protein ACRC7S_13165 [Cetobacterium sp.]|uniref:hypothetical protein n=1 Tax=uncultured Cetobacterium sp. TaxID=527638 RepID=UPI00261F8BF9|nr:hypothetical protein [uncultured Cetobacterium sp.]